MIPVLDGAEWLARRRGFDRGPTRELEESVRGILEEVRTRGDAGLRAVAARLGDEPPELLSPERMRAVASSLESDSRGVLERAAANIEGFAAAIAESLRPVRVERPGFATGMRYRAVDRVGCYVPGGRYPLPSTALMTALSARAAGVGEVYLVCPALHPAVAHAGLLAGVRGLYRMGGAQAVAALAYGTETVAPVDMVVGPGNAYVTEAKRQLQGVIGIDMLAGPSEVAIVADETAAPDWVALDLLAQAEHDPDARAYLLTPSRQLAEAVAASLAEDVERLRLPAFLRTSLGESALLVFPDLSACLQACDRIAPEHLHLQLDGADALRDQVRHYGGLFLGHRAAVPFGDYMAGPNHTLPTGRTARFAAGLSPLTFLRPQCWLQVDDSSLLAADTARFAELEGLTAHAAAARARL